MILNTIYSKLRRRLRKKLLSLLENSYKNKELDSIEAKLVALACKEVVTCYFGLPVPDKVYDTVGQEVANVLDEVNNKLQRRIKEDE